MTAYLNLLVCLALLLSGVHSACADYSSSSSCPDADCVWKVTTSEQCTAKSITDCTLEICGNGGATKPEGCIYTDGIPGECTMPDCGSKPEALCGTAVACDWTAASTVCAMPDTVTCVDSGKVCRTEPVGKESCAYAVQNNYCQNPTMQDCEYWRVVGLCYYNTEELGHSTGCKISGHDCIVDLNVNCSKDSTTNKCTETSIRAGCLDKTVGFSCSPKQCNVAGTNAEGSCDADSLEAGCELSEKPAACNLKAGVICIEAVDGACDADSLCDSVASVPAKCEPDTSLTCSSDASGGCDQTSLAAGCKSVPETGSCVEKKKEETGSSARIVSASSVVSAVALISTMFFLN